MKIHAVLKLSVVRIILLIPVGGALWWLLSWYTRLGFFHPMWVGALTALAIDCWVISRRMGTSLSKLGRRGILIAVMETTVAVLTFAVALAIFTYFTLPPPDA